MDSIPAAVILGVICGLLGAFFVVFNARIGKIRKLYINTDCSKVFEAIFFAVLTSSAFYWMPK